jgi:tetratricopeptide (TPR) repeat protein
VSASAREAERRVGALVEMGRLDEALALVGEALATEPTSRLWCSLGYVQLARGEPEETLCAVEQAIPEAPQSEWPLRLRALALSRLGRRDAAIASARAAVGVEPQSAPAWTVVAELLAYAGDTTGARSAAMRAYELAPDSDYTLVTLLYVAGHASDWDMCERVATALLRRQPKNARALHALGRVAEWRGDLEGALDLYSRALAANPGDTNLLAWVQDTLIDLGRIDEAIESSRRVLEIWPDHARAWCGVAQGACAAGRFEEALAAADRAVELAPGDDFARRLRARALWALERDTEAIACSAAATEYADTGSLPARPWVAYARMLMSADRLDEADRAMTNAVRHGPHLVLVNSTVARLALARREPGRAAAAAAAALRQDDRDFHAHCAAGYAGAARGDWEFARAAFSRAHELCPRYCCTRAGLLLARIELDGPAVDVAAGLREVDEVSPTCRCELVARIKRHG